MRYLDQLDLRKTGEREWEQLADFRFESDLYPGVFISPKGTKTNLASIPRIAWRILPPIGNYDEAAVIHDAGCRGKLITPDGKRINTIKSVRDKLFLEALGCETFRKSKVGPRLAKVMYFAVKYFGNRKGRIVDMPTEVITIGPVFTMTQNVVYALPASRCLLFCQTVTPGLEQSNVIAFTTVVAVALTAGQSEVAGGFIRSTAAGGAIVTLKKA